MGCGRGKKPFDKARALAAGKQGAYEYPATMDCHSLACTGIGAEALLAEVRRHRSGGEMLAWVLQHMRPARHASEIAQWSHWRESLLGFATPAFYNYSLLSAAARARVDAAWLELFRADCDASGTARFHFPLAAFLVRRR